MYRNKQMLFIIIAVYLMSLPVQLAAQEECPAAPPSMLSVGDRGRVTFTDGSATNLRAEASTSSVRLMQMPEGFEFEVIDGPVCADGYQFWQIQTDSGVIGWAAEGNRANYWLEPVPPLPADSITNMQNYDLIFKRGEAILAFDLAQQRTVQLFSLEAYPQLAASTITCPSFSPDGRFMAYADTGPDQKFRVQVFDTGTNDLVAAFADSFGTTWRPNTTQLTYANNDGLFVLEASTGESTRLMPRDMAPMETVPPGILLPIIPLRWSANGQRLFMGDVAYEGIHSYGVFDAGAQSYLDWDNLDYFDWSPDAERVAYSVGGSIFIASYDASNVQQILDDADRPMTAPAWSPDGRYLVMNAAGVSDYDNSLSIWEDLWLYDLQSGALSQLTDHEVKEKHWSPDGASLIIRRILGPENAEWNEISILPLNGAEPVIIGEGRCARWARR